MGGSWARALNEEVKGQPSVLERFSRKKVARARSGSIFVGAGDSYAAAMAGFYASGGQCIALDPYSLASAPELAKGVDVFLISVSGRTSANLAAVARVRRVASRMTAITAVRSSPLGEQVGDVVELPMSYAPRTPGILSFSLSLLAVLKIAGGVVEGDFPGAFAAALKDSPGVAWGRGVTYFLGNLLAYPAALYAAAKTYEILGARAQPELLEEFSHLELFSLRRSDVVNVFSCFDPSGTSAKLSRVLKHGGYETRLVADRGRSDLDSLFHAVFLTQLSMVTRAKQLGLSGPRFLAAGKKLRASDRMIY